MSDPTLSDIDFENKMASVWTTLKIMKSNFSHADIQENHTSIFTVIFVSRLWKEVGSYCNKTISYALDEGIFYLFDWLFHRHPTKLLLEFRRFEVFCLKRPRLSFFSFQHQLQMYPVNFKVLLDIKIKTRRKNHDWIIRIINFNDY